MNCSAIAALFMFDYRLEPKEYPPGYCLSGGSEPSVRLLLQSTAIAQLRLANLCFEGSFTSSGVVALTSSLHGFLLMGIRVPRAAHCERGRVRDQVLRYLVRSIK